MEPGLTISEMLPRAKSLHGAEAKVEGSRAGGMCAWLMRLDELVNYSRSELTNDAPSQWQLTQA